MSLIEKFIEDTSQMRIGLSIDKRNNECQDVYFFLGKDSVLCISKQENKILYQLKYSQLQISILGANEFAFNVGGQSLFFCQNDELIKATAFHENIEEQNSSSIVVNMNTIPEESYKFKSFCEKCNSRKCSQYDAINGRRFKFGKGPVSEDMLNQYDKYCEEKIKKFKCSL